MVIIDGEESDTCPRRPVLDNPAYFSEVIRLYRLYQKGILPEEGGYFNQSYKLMRLFDIIDVTLDQCDQDRKAKEHAKNNRGRVSKDGR